MVNTDIVSRFDGEIALGQGQFERGKAFAKGGGQLFGVEVSDVTGNFVLGGIFAAADVEQAGRLFLLRPAVVFAVSVGMKPA